MSTQHEAEGRSREELQRLAQRFGLVNLAPDQLDELAQAEAYMAGFAVRFPRELALTDEPAFIFHAGSTGGTGSTEGEARP